MKKLIFALMATLALAGCEGNEPEPVKNNATKFDGLNGNVQSCTMNHYDAKEESGKIVIMELRSKYEYIYDAEGNRIKDIAYSPDGDIRSLINYEYKDGILVNQQLEDLYTQIEESRYTTTKLIGKEGNTYTYIKFDGSNKDKPDTIREVYHPKLPGLPEIVYTKYSKTVYTYNDNGNVIDYKSFELDNGKLSTHKISTYKDNLIVRQVAKSFFDSGTTEFVVDIEYTNFDKNGNWIRRITRFNGSVSSITERSINYRN